MRHLLLSLAVLLAAPLAWAEELASAPGWSLTKIEQQKEEGDYSYGDGRVYFALKPPDQRPAVTIDARTADRLRAGEVAAEIAYGGTSNKAAGSQDQGEEFVYGNKNNGIVMPDPITSTLTTADGRKDPPVAAAEEPKRSSASTSESSLSGLGSGESSFKSYAGSSQPPPSAQKNNASGASAPPPSAGAEAATAAAGGTPIRNPAEQAQAEQARPVDANVGLFSGGVTANNAAAGFGVSKAEKSEEGSEKDFVVWPNGDPNSDNANKPSCPQTTRRVLDKPGLTRIEGRKGCPILKVYVWGAGGGYGGANQEGSQVGGRGGPAAYVFTQGTVDVSKFDVIVLVGAEGRNAVGPKGGSDSAFGGGGAGGNSETGAAGGGGGGFSGVFLVDRSKYGPTDLPIDADKAIAIAAGGGGGSGSGSRGGEGGVLKGGGANGATDKAPGPGIGNGGSGVFMLGGQGGNAMGDAAGGGGAGGGYFGGGGGSGSDATLSGGDSGSGGGGSSFYRFLDNFQAQPGSGSKPGGADHSERGKAGEPGYPGKVILEFY